MRCFESIRRGGGVRVLGEERGEGAEGGIVGSFERGYYMLL